MSSERSLSLASHGRIVGSSERWMRPADLRLVVGPGVEAGAVPALVERASPATWREPSAVAVSVVRGRHGRVRICLAQVGANSWRPYLYLSIYLSIRADGPDLVRSGRFRWHPYTRGLTACMLMPLTVFNVVTLLSVLVDLSRFGATATAIRP